MRVRASRPRIRPRAAGRGLNRHGGSARPRFYEDGKSSKFRGLDVETALRLACYFGNSPRFWLNLQSGFGLAVAERDLGARIEAEVGAAT